MTKEEIDTITDLLFGNGYDMLKTINDLNNKLKEKTKEIERLNNIIFKAHKMIYDNYGVLDKYEIDILDDILTGKELKEGK